MAEFCRQCMKELFGADTSDMKGRVTEEQFAADWVGTGLCEGCGGGEFDPQGNCLGSCEKPEHGTV